MTEKFFKVFYMSWNFCETLQNLPLLLKFFEPKEFSNFSSQYLNVHSYRSFSTYWVSAVVISGRNITTQQLRGNPQLWDQIFHHIYRLIANTNQSYFCNELYPIFQESVASAGVGAVFRAPDCVWCLQRCPKVWNIVFLRYLPRVWRKE